MIIGKYLISILLCVCTLFNVSAQDVILIAVNKNNRITKYFTDYEEAITFFSTRPNFKGKLYNVSETDFESFVIIIPEPVDPPAPEETEKIKINGNRRKN